MTHPDSLPVLRCAIHVHTSYDDGSLPMAEVIGVARDSGVDVLMASGHNQMQSLDAYRYQGMHDGVLAIIGSELDTCERDHLLCFGIHDRVATIRLSAPDSLNLLAKLGGKVFVAHPQGRPFKHFFGRQYRWEHWNSPGFAGVEIWSYMQDWIDCVTPFNVAGMCKDPDPHISGPDPEVLREWDRLAETRHVSGIGGLDTHGKLMPLGLGRFFGWAREGILPYRQNFTAFATYLHAAALTGNTHEDAAQVLRHLCAGHCWACHDALGSGRNFRYYAHRENESYVMGEQTPWKPGFTLTVEAPQDCRVTITNRGECVAQTEGRRLDFIPQTPGEYRATLELDGRAWIVSNHIYLRG